MLAKTEDGLYLLVRCSNSKQKANRKQEKEKKRKPDHPEADRKAGETDEKPCRQRCTFV